MLIIANGVEGVLILAAPSVVSRHSKIRTNAPCVPQRLAHTLRIGKVPKVSQLQQLLLFATHSFAAFVCATAAQQLDTSRSGHENGLFG